MPVLPIDMAERWRRPFLLCGVVPQVPGTPPRTVPGSGVPVLPMMNANLSHENDRTATMLRFLGQMKEREEIPAATASQPLHAGKK
ncbi:hypothetical protein HBDW_10410 [Herbaspirillum sp. DW155]|uniref:hypothetical protein n=1 Tax=Herbaspirillum sp. DW155 TaxID=3095609 RepID=UPI003089C7BD|nr:hypothetical protein HBDW_10410 [Herbaspirillum sp. DW155]